jgi:hypothetical protein
VVYELYRLEMISGIDESMPLLYMAFFLVQSIAHRIHLGTIVDGSVNLVASPIFSVALSSVAFF